MVKKKKIKDPIVLLQGKLATLKKKRQAFLQQYDIDTIENQYTSYRKNKHPNHKKGWDAYNKFIYFNKKIRKINSELLSKYNIDDNLDSSDSDNDLGASIILKCANCHRRNLQNISPNYELNLQPVLSNTIKGDRPFAFVSGTRSGNPIEYQLCRQCSIHLTDPDNGIALESKNMWPGVFWYLLQSQEIYENYTPQFIWTLFPKQWREWWIDEVKSQFPSFYNEVTLHDPAPIFIDRTTDYETWNIGINSGILSNIADVCNKILMPTVLCPWGCSDFLHSAGEIDIVLVLQRYLRKINLNSDGDDLAVIDPARDDYIRKTFDDYDTWLHNPNWRVAPTIVMKNGIPYVLTCKDHNGGSSYLHVHCLRWKTNISSHLSDQLCHAVVKPRTVKTMKVGYNSTSYQMVEQRSSWKGPDTINVTTCGRSDHGSIILQEAEARSYANRTDMKSLISRLINDGKFSHDHAEGIEEFSQFFSESFDYNKYKYGSTYIPAEIAMSMKEEARNREVFGTIDDQRDSQGNVINPFTRKFKRIWPLYIYPCQKLCSYGAKMYAVPKYCVNNSKTLWTLSSLLLHVEPLWNITAKSTLLRSQWIGYILVYLTKNCLHHLKRRVVGIFKALSVSQLSNKVNGYGGLSKFFILYYIQIYFSNLFIIFQRISSLNYR